MGIKINNKESKFPIIQGGMGVGVSLHNLAGNVSLEGGIGVLSAASIGYKKELFKTNPKKANLKAIDEEIKKARKICGEDKILAINIMVAMKDYENLVKRSVENKIDLIISGAGLPKNLPELVEGSKTKIAPIVSSLRACQFITKYWITKYNYVPDMIIVEGPKAGGHLGFKKEEIKEKNLEDIIKEVLEYIRIIEKEKGKDIPLIAAGGIWSSKDIKKYLDLGCNGVQIGTRFVTTKECDASNEFKRAYINAKAKDIKIISSPVGMPGRALSNKFIKSLEKENKKINKCYSCIKTCDINTTPYCITKALINAVNGNIDEGLIFCGEVVAKIKEITTVKKLMKELTKEL